MSARKNFIDKGIQRVLIDEYLQNELKGAGYGSLEIRSTPLGTRVYIYAQYPGVVIGQRGSTVQKLTKTLEDVYGLENPQIEVMEIKDSTLNARVMAEQIASSLSRGIKYRRAGYGALRRIKEAGAKGVEIAIKGKLTSHRAREQKFRSGFVAKCGEPAKTQVESATAPVIVKAGVIGVKVKIMRDMEGMPDQVHLKSPPPMELQLTTPEPVEETKTPPSLKVEPETKPEEVKKPKAEVKPKVQPKEKPEPEKKARPEEKLKPKAEPKRKAKPPTKVKPKPKTKPEKKPTKKKEEKLKKKTPKKKEPTSKTKKTPLKSKSTKKSTDIKPKKKEQTTASKTKKSGKSTKGDQ